jgi:hypothetical protein
LYAIIFEIKFGHNITKINFINMAI